jgi:hypothetical protein
MIKSKLGILIDYEMLNPSHLNVIQESISPRVILVPKQKQTNVIDWIAFVDETNPFLKGRYQQVLLLQSSNVMFYKGDLVRKRSAIAIPSLGLPQRSSHNRE